MRRAVVVTVAVLLMVVPSSRAFHPPGPPRPYDEEPDHCVWWRADYMMWWLQKSPIPFPLVTTSSTGLGNGALGNPGTVVLLPASGLSYPPFNSLRLATGFWFDAYGIFGMEASAFITQLNTAGFGRTSDAAGTQVLAVPFFDNATQTESSFQVSGQGVTSGRIAISTQALFGGGNVDFVLTPVRTPCAEINFISGFRYLALYEQLALAAGRTEIATGNTENREDTFRTLTQFFGAELGGRIRARGDVAFAELTGKVGLGANTQMAEVNGQTTTVTGGVTTISNGGIFAQNSNSGVFHQTEFAVVPEVEGRVGLELSSHLKISIGYQFIYWSSVLRAGNQMNRAVTFGGPANPVFNFNPSGFIAHGANAGLELRY